MVKRLILLMVAALTVVTGAMAGTLRDDDDKNQVMKRDIRRLHPERERAKAQKKLLEQMSHKADPKADPWDTSDEVWGTVDVPRMMGKDSLAVEGHRLTSTAAQSEGRMVWQDDPVVIPLDQLMLGMTVDDSGEYRSRYVSPDGSSSEFYFAFSVGEDSVPEPLRLCVRYCADSPLDYDQVIFTVDGYDYIFYPAIVDHGRTADGVYWSASDDGLHPAYRDLIYALAHGHWAMVKLVGMNGVSRVKVLTDGQLEDFATSLMLYRLLGGEI